MSATQPGVTKKEMEFAYYFLHRLGANISNGYLFTAVVAWLRAEVGFDLKHMYNKNNPLNIRSSKYAIGYRKTSGNGSFALFSSLKAGAYAAADMLVGARHDWRHYDRIVAAARRSASGSKNQQAQALDFIEAIALSKWDAGHYGLNKGERTVATYNVLDVSIAKIWFGISGALPKIKVEPDKQPKKSTPPRPQPPAPLPPPSTLPDYLSGSETEAFYSASRPSSDLGTLPPM